MLNRARATEMVVPDLIEPFVAWRVWDVTVEGNAFLLESVFYKARWRPGYPLEARCNFGCTEIPGDESRHSANTAFSMPCGIYAGKTLAQTAHYLPPCFSDPSAIELRRTRAVIGKVAMWGVVKEHRKGYRAKYAKPLALWLPVSFGFPFERFGLGPETVARVLAEEYEIPVGLFRRLSELEDA